LFGAGQSIIGGLAAGIGSNVGAAAAAAASAAASVVASARSALAAKSPSRKFMELGKWAMQGFAIGINDNSNAAGDAVRQAFDGFDPPSFGSASAAGYDHKSPSSSSTPTVVNNITVNTQEIDPRSNAEELGWRLANRVGIQ
jgi:hypothetical protein